MLFCSAAYLLFFAVVFLAYWATPWKRARVYLLLVASVYFYASWEWRLVFIILVSATFDYAVARLLGAATSPIWRRALLGLSVGANLSLLCYFKYANFFLGSLQRVLHATGSESSMPVLSVLVPLGISFYTFEAISYVVDVYRGRVEAERSLANFLLFILFFPHLIAGPIVRARDFLPQIARAKRWSWVRAEAGIGLFILGLVKKWAVADRMAQFVDPVYANPGAFDQTAVWVAVLAYALQIYCDFSGYSDMALGCAHLLGYELARNFDLPFLTPNVSEFWRRWHVSLSSWLRDYVFFPLGGSRGGALLTCRNVMITMTLCGLWHGANWTFVAWGAVQGAFLIIHRAFQGFCAGRPLLQAELATTAGVVLRVGLTFLCFSLSMVLFRSESFGVAGQVFGRLLADAPGARGTPLPLIGFTATAVAVGLGHLLARRGLWKHLVRPLPAPVVGLSYGAMLLLAMTLVPDGRTPFIYFQF
jgi:alginate O-acetyltransferase complex protein AlgI